MFSSAICTKANVKTLLSKKSRRLWIKQMCEIMHTIRTAEVHTVSHRFNLQPKLGNHKDKEDLFCFLKQETFAFYSIQTV